MRNPKSKNKYRGTYMAVDAFGRLRTTDSSFTTFEYYPTLLSQTNVDHDIWFSMQSGTTLISYDSTNNYIKLMCQQTGSKVTRLTRLPMIYQPGKSHMVYITGVLLNRPIISGEEVISRAGLFDVDENQIPISGIYLETDGNELRWTDHTQLSITTVTQAQWNIDSFDGNGASGKILISDNILKVYLIVIDQQWLSVGRIRVGFNINGITYYAHQFDHSNLSIPYTKSSQGRICYQLIGNVLQSGIEARQFACTSLSEGGYFPLGRNISVSTPLGGISLADKNMKYVILAIRVNPIHQGGIIRPTDIECSLLTSGNGRWCKYELHMIGAIGTLQGSLSYVQSPDGITQYAIGNGSQTLTSDGYIINSGFVLPNIIEKTHLTKYLLTRNVGSYLDTYVLIGSGNKDNNLMTGRIDFIESV